MNVAVNLDYEKETETVRVSNTIENRIRELSETEVIIRFRKETKESN